ncbi:hypothetical protein TRFO_12966 [Tritrichomonas foetus]|uniref:Protein kinase domain-containing protein n=1 Tax=Tritrichomonas foetus TaxID=1144522 RepID=A0A1J4L408_9EUKA|nr:hypothetical protein TRFO_12966 [Tritrichomonas foetus]|eukprot:OHT16708.1 hypothetical protein TRFO_12966 [Tritrichomonas foetus]
MPLKKLRLYLVIQNYSCHFAILNSMDDNLSSFMIDLSDYVKKETKGSGSFSNVYLIQNKTDGKLYAAKESKKPLQDSQKEVINEIKILAAAMNCPSIIKLYGFNRTNFDNQPFPVIIMEYMKHGSLLSILDQERSCNAHPNWTPTKKYINILGIALGMKKLHSQNIIHRDLKPANILMDENLYPKICDFGISKMLMDNQNCQTEAGTPQYMAPEIILNKEYNNKVDVFSFALIVYEIVAGRQPYDFSRGIYCCLENIKNGERPDLTYVESYQQKEFLIKCWDQNPKNRPSFDQIITDILKEKIFEPEDFDYVEVSEYLEQFGIDYDAEFEIVDMETTKNLEKTHEQFQIARRDGFGYILNSLQQNTPKRIEMIKRVIDNLDSDVHQPPNKLLYISFAMLSLLISLTVSQKYIFCFIASLVPDNDTKLLFYKLSSDLGYSISTFRYALIKYNNMKLSNNKNNIAEIATCFKKAAQDNITESMYFYGKMVKKGQGISKNETEAEIYFEKAAKAGHVPSMYKYAMILKKYQALRVSDYKHFMKQAARNNYSKAFYPYGLIVLKDNPKKAAALFKQAADDGHCHAAKKYGDMLTDKSSGIEYDPEEGAKYLDLSSKCSDYYRVTNAVNSFANNVIDILSKKIPKLW